MDAHPVEKRKKGIMKIEMEIRRNILMVCFNTRNQVDRLKAEDY